MYTRAFSVAKQFNEFNDLKPMTDIKKRKGFENIEQLKLAISDLSVDMKGFAGTPSSSRTFALYLGSIN